MQLIGNAVKKKLRTRTLCVGSWIAMDHPWVADIMAQCGYEFLVFELEHSVMELAPLSHLFAMCELHDVVPMARLSSNDAVQAKRVLEAGAYGLIFPMINTVQDARDAVAAAKYPPVGRRGFGLGRAQDYGFGSAEYFRCANDETIVILQIEHIEGVENAEAILDIDEVDGILIGPYDLSGSLGLPGELHHPRVTEACQRLLDLAAAKGKAAGLHVVHPDAARLQETIDRGFTFIPYGGDILYLGESCKAAMDGVAQFLPTTSESDAS